jgi:hypothetical protein
MIAFAVLVLLTMTFLSLTGVVAIARTLSPSSPSLAIAGWWRGVLVVTMQPVPGRPVFS